MDDIIHAVYYCTANNLNCYSLTPDNISWITGAIPHEVFIIASKQLFVRVGEATQVVGTIY